MVGYGKPLILVKLMKIYLMDFSVEVLVQLQLPQAIQILYMLEEEKSLFEEMFLLVMEYGSH